MANTSKAHTSAEPKKLACNCKHAYQDARYGPGQRLHNPCIKGHRCTVCGNEK